MTEEEQEIRGVIGTYYSLIINILSRIYDAWDKGNYELALTRTLHLKPFLPRKLKNKLEEDVTKIKEALYQAQNISGFDGPALEREKNRRITKVAKEFLEPLIDRNTTLLDEENLLTQKYGVPTRRGDLSKIGESLA